MPPKVPWSVASMKCPKFWWFDYLVAQTQRGRLDANHAVDAHTLQDHHLEQRFCRDRLCKETQVQGIDIQKKPTARNFTVTLNSFWYQSREDHKDSIEHSKVFLHTSRLVILIVKWQKTTESDQVCKSASNMSNFSSLSNTWMLRYRSHQQNRWRKQSPWFFSGCSKMLTYWRSEVNRLSEFHLLTYLRVFSFLSLLYTPTYIYWSVIECSPHAVLLPLLLVF